MLGIYTAAAVTKRVHIFFRGFAKVKRKSRAVGQPRQRPEARTRREEPGEREGEKKTMKLPDRSTGQVGRESINASQFYSPYRRLDPREVASREVSSASRTVLKAAPPEGG